MDQTTHFHVNNVEDIGLAGFYSISYSVFLTEYTFIRVEKLDAFVVHVEDPCAVSFNRPNWCPKIITEVNPEFLPEWLENLTDQEVTLGGANLEYVMGEPINVFNQTMDVEIRGGLADVFIQYDKFFNRFIVDQDDLYPELIGQYLIEVIGSYQGINGKTVKLKKELILTVNPPAEKVEEPEEPVDPKQELLKKLV